MDPLIGFWALNALAANQGEPALGQLPTHSASFLPMTANLAELLPQIVTLADQAGAVIMDHYRGDIEVKTKADSSPVTAADEASEAVILERLARLTPTIPVVAEEKVAAGDIPDLDAGPFWLVDPLDGTKEFISKNGEFTVNIALVSNEGPLLGVVFGASPQARLVGGKGPRRQRARCRWQGDAHPSPACPCRGADGGGQSLPQ